MKQMKVESLWIYPVKSCAGISVNELEILKGGPRWDRTWMIVDENGQFQTQRQIPKMALIGTELTGSDLILRIDGYAFQVPLAAGDLPKRTVKVWKSEVDGYLEDPLISDQLSTYLGKKVFLVRSLESQRQYGIRYSDSRPVQLANMDSLKALNQELNQNIAMERFRPNIVVSGIGTFAEDKLTEFSVGPIQFEVSKPCIRCNIINVDPATGLRPNADPLTKLKEIHSIEGQPAFGVLLVPKSTGTLALV